MPQPFQPNIFATVGNLPFGRGCWSKTITGNIISRQSYSLLATRGFLFFRQFVVPTVVAQTQLAWQRFGLSDADFAALLQKFLNKRFIGRFFWDMFHALQLS